MGEVLLSAALIVRDEGKFLAGCLESIAGFVDEAVVVDTGSVDRSREIALDHGARVADYAWQGDFSAARNHALDLARGQWILYIDADERVSVGNRTELEPLLREPRIAACTVRFRPVTGFTRYREYRLFRNRPDLRFRGVIHETHVPALNQLCVREGMRIAHSRVCIDHHGYDGDQSHKHPRNLPLLRARLEVDPFHVYSWCHLGGTLAGMGDAAGAEEAWRQAVTIVRERPVRTIIDSAPYCDLLRCLLARGERPVDLATEALQFFPSNLTLQWLYARTLIEAERYSEAIPVLEGLLAADPEAGEGFTIAHDVRIFGHFAFEALGLCAFRLGRFADSARWYGSAEKAAPEPLENRTKRMLAESLHRS
jgi:tetratricopeptide (TPR) repeat protein